MSVRCLAVDWSTSPPVAALGATSAPARRHRKPVRAGHRPQARFVKRTLPRGLFNLLSCVSPARRHRKSVQAGHRPQAGFLLRAGNISLFEPDTGHKLGVLKNTHQGNISLFELDTGRKLGVLKRHDAEVSAVLWMAHPEAQPASATEGAQNSGSKGAAAGLLVSGSQDGGLMVWDVRQPRSAVLAGRLQGV
eukprot:901940-Pelagomonas_calceolata.AAC.1